MGNVKEAFQNSYNHTVKEFLNSFLDTQYFDLMSAVAGYEPIGKATDQQQVLIGA